MILQALYEYYTAMAAQGKMARRGWSPAKVSFALLIDEQGTLLDVLRLKEKELGALPGRLMHQSWFGTQITGVVCRQNGRAST